MHRAVLFFVLLFLPGTTLHDWQQADAPHLHRLMQTGALALMNARTAEKDKVTTDAGERSILAGARMYAIGSLQSPGYSVLPDNLLLGLRSAGVDVETEAAGQRQTGQRLALPLQRSGAEFVCARATGDWEQIDEQIGHYAAIAGTHAGDLMIVSPNPSPTEYAAGDQLTPALLWGKGVPPGFLASSSTRRTGLITNTDIAPTVASAMGAKLPVPAFGAAAQIVPNLALNRQAADQLAAADRAWVSQARGLRLLPYVAAVIGLLVATMLSVGAVGKYRSHVCVFTSLLPLALAISTNSAEFVLLCLLGLALAVLHRSTTTSVSTVATALAFIILLSAVSPGGGIAGRSLLGFSPIEGARYYGVGNEEMGACVGSLVVVSRLLEIARAGRMWNIVLWVVAGLCLALPWTGAKAGAFIVCATALTGFCLASAGARLTEARSLLWFAAAVALSIGLLVLVSRIGPTTHVTQAVTKAQTHGLRAIVDTILRKAGMDLHLVFHSVWACVLGLTAYGRYRLKNTTVASQVGTAATVACLIFNDAGVVAAALCGLMVWGMDVSEHHPHHVDPSRNTTAVAAALL